MLGKIVPVEEVKARWAYAETRSSRFGADYDPVLPARLVESARNGVPFDQIAPEDRPLLAEALPQARVRRFVEQVHFFGADHFECVHWSASELLNCLTLPIFGLVPIFRFLAMPHRTDADGNVREDDPRHVAVSLPFDRDFVVEEPVIVVREAKIRFAPTAR